MAKEAHNIEAREKKCERGMKARRREVFNISVLKSKSKDKVSFF
jgi:hypothetical protein